MKPVEELTNLFQGIMTYIPEDAKWYLAWTVMEITVEGDPRNVVHTNLHLIRADSPDEAYEKAIALGKESEISYENPEGKLVTFVFRGLKNLVVVYDELEHGAELTYDEKIEVSEADIQRMLTPKDQLTVFDTTGVSDKPNYEAKEVVEELAKRFVCFEDPQDTI